MRLSFKIFMASLLPFMLIAVAYQYLTTSLFSGYLIDNYRQQTGSKLYHVEENIRYFLEQLEGELRIVAKEELLDPKHPKQSRKALNNFLHHDDSFAAISAITANGREWLRLSRFSLPTEPDAPRNLFYAPVYQVPLLGMKSYVGYSRLEPDFALPFFDISIPVKNRQTGQISGVLWLKSYSQPVQDILEDALPARGKIMLLRSDNNEVIIQADDTRQDYGNSERKALLTISSADQTTGWLESDQTTFLYRKFNYSGLEMTLVFYQPHQTIYYLANQLKIYNLRVAFIGVILFILASFVLTRMTISPLARVTGQIVELGRRYKFTEKGDPRQAEVQSADEIVQLCTSFALLKERLATYSDDIEAEIRVRKKTEEELRDIQEQLEERIKKRTLALENTHAQLLHAEKLATSGSMAASIAHEFGNPLCGIKAVLASIAAQDTVPADTNRMVKMALDECERMNVLIQNLQDFNRPSSGEKTLINLHRVIDDIIIFSRQNFARKAIEIEREYDPVLPPIMVISDQIKQVFMNLINNSTDACSEGGVISISTKAEEDRIVLHFSDNGQGIKQNNLSRIFDPFFTTKPVAMGTGLGLSVSYGIIRSHGGDITVTSKLGAGTTFTVILPIVDDRDDI